MESKKLTKKELEGLKETIETSQKKTHELGSLNYSLYKIKERIEAITRELESLEFTQSKDLEKLEKKYGEGNINLDEGTISINK